MITTGFVTEGFYLSRVLNKTLYFEIIPSDEYGNDNLLPLCVKITPNGVLTINYRGSLIWNETIIGPAAFFGVESVDNISRIMACIDNKDNSWKQKYYYNEKSS